MRFSAFVRSHLNSWNEICFDERARLRNNVLLFTFTISCIFFVMNVRTVVSLGVEAAIPATILNAVSLALFLWQFFRKRYSLLIAWTFGAMSLVMVVYFLWTGGVMGTSHLWLYILPIVGTMMVTLPWTLLYNGLLMAILVVMMYTPLHELMPQQYNAYFRTVFPLSMLAVIACNYVAEYARYKTQRQLLIVTDKLRNSAFTDPLTGAYNRRALSSHFGGMEESAYGLSFAMLDLDFFKKVNDTYGHDAGDRVLCHTVELIRANVPANAYLYRWGGEEFLLVLKTTDCAQMEAVLERIRERAAGEPVIYEGHGGRESIAISLSIGGVCARSGERIGDCINEADERLYKAKESGRNRVVTA